MSIFIWEWKNDYSAMQWPCPAGFHIPTLNEINTMYSYMNTLWLANTWLNFKEKLLLPNSARLKQQTWARENVNYSYLLTCNSAANGSASGIRIAQSSIYTWNNWTLSKSGWHSIRPFRDTPVTPDSSRTTIYDWSWTAAGAWVFHNPMLWIISLSGDWTNRLTIADKNLWATQVWYPWDTLTSANAGKYYQRWNNYWFDMTWATTTSSTKVDASTHWPWNYYSSSTFITDSNSSVKAWDTTINTNLRWWTTWVVKVQNDKAIYSWVGKDSYEAMRWPCPYWFHIPTIQEWTDVRDHGKDLWLWTTTSSSANATSFRTYLKIPVAWFYSMYGSFSTTTWRYWCCQDKSTWTQWGHRIYNNANFWINYYSKGWWESIRPFKDTPAIPDNTWTTTFDWSWIATGAWVFHNATLWLISISSDWINWVTIADKNLWATVVYNNWDALSDSNCWWVFQWGNCYMFPRSSTLSTSSTQIDTTWYWPWNYYFSNKFITWSWSTFNWSSVNDRNLRWWITWVTKAPNVTAYVWTTKVRPKWISTPWVYHNASKWLISVSDDGKRWITLADKNLWANLVWNSGDTLSQDNCGYFYQYGNNYSFPYTWATTTSSSQIDATWYWPTNRYQSSTWVNYSGGNGWTWDSAGNADLWGDSTRTKDARRWPCPNWWHIPTVSEMLNLIDYWVTISAWGAVPSVWADFFNLLHIPQVVLYNWTTAMNAMWWLMLSSFGTFTTWCWDWFSINGTSWWLTNATSTMWYGIRPFKNEPVIPDSTWTVVYPY